MIPRRVVSHVVVLALVLLAGPWPWLAGAKVPGAAQNAQGARTTVIVEIDPGANPQAVARQLGVTPTFVYNHVFNGFAAELPAAAITAAGRAKSVVKITPDFPVHAVTQILPTGVDRIDDDQNPQAAINQDGGAIDADVAVLDTGIDKQRDLTIAGGKSCIDGRDYSDGFGHGTHVAGTIGARDNVRGVVGVAPGVRLWAVKVLDDRGTGTASSVICGLDWVLGKGTIDVVNMSLAGAGRDGDCADDPYHRAVCKVVRAGVPVVVAAGNDRDNASHYVPAAYDEVITVSAFADLDGQPGAQAGPRCGDEDDTFASFSNYGPDVDIAAPGVCILSISSKGGTKTMSGTSMAAPHVAGAAALYKETHPGASAEEVKTWLLTQASRPQTDPTYGFTGDPDGSHEPVLYLGPVS